MSILIQGMEMPKSCFCCPFRLKFNPDEIKCLVTREEFEETFSGTIETRHWGDCPLIEVPPHGRLIDADELMKKIFGNSLSGREWSELVLTKDKNELQTALFNLPIMFNNAPTIIPADKED